MQLTFIRIATIIYLFYSMNECIKILIHSCIETIPANLHNKVEYDAHCVESCIRMSITAHAVTHTMAL